MCVVVHPCSCMHGDQKRTSVTLYRSLPYSLRWGLSSEPGTRLVSSKPIFLHVPPTGVTGMQTAMSSFLCRFWDLNSGSLVCIVSAVTH